jgi:hypothetical protein
MSPLAAVAPDQRAVVALMLQQGRAHEDIAAVLGIPVAAVRWRAHAATRTRWGATASSLIVQGPSDTDLNAFPQLYATYAHVLVSPETRRAARRPLDPVLRGPLRRGRGRA